ncbi:MAG: right-handed parallel beta-helix repeat-containing protein, partial [Steroidobacter sp.]
TVEQIEASASADDLTFETAETVDGLSFGLLGDGVTDNTAAFTRVLSTGNRTIHVPAGDYVTGKLVIPSNTILMLAPGVIIRDSGLLAKHDRLINIIGHNVHIQGLGASVVSRRSDYTTDEWRHGVHIFGASRVVIEGLESSNHGGDGFYIGGPAGNPSTDIYLKGCRADNNRRQGLSITSARRVRIIDCEFMNTNGTAPQFGVDLEPNDPVDFLDDIVLLRPYTRTNQGGGILICLNGLDASSYPVNVSIVEHASVTEAPNLQTLAPPEVKATLRYSRQY